MNMLIEAIMAVLTVIGSLLTASRTNLGWLLAAAPPRRQRSYPRRHFYAGCLVRDPPQSIPDPRPGICGLRGFASMARRPCLAPIGRMQIGIAGKTKANNLLERSMNPAPHYRYPAITACIAEERGPNRAELRLVAPRIWREGMKYLTGDTPSFGQRRKLVRAALTALGGVAIGRR